MQRVVLFLPLAPGDIVDRVAKQFLRVMPVRFLLPVVLTVLLFVMTIFLFIIPLVEERLMEGKREVIHALTESAWSALNVYASDPGLTKEEAMTKAVEHLRGIRYGPEKKDYFWINDMHPRVIMHPYRPDLEGKDNTDFKDPAGKRIFVECVKIVEKEGAGYLDYQWQWKDDPSRIVPKISFVKGFAPWGWIIGTGIYVEDVRAGIASITRQMTLICLGILSLIMALSSYIVWNGMKVTREKKKAQEQARLRQTQLFQAAKMASLGTLVSGVAHEINNPVTSIMLNTPTLKKVWDAIIPILDEYEGRNGDFKVGGMKYSMIRQRIPILLEGIADGAVRVKDIVADLKDFARDTPAEMSDTVDINEVAKKAVGLVTNMIKKSTDRFSLMPGKDVPLFKGNARRIEQVIINLLVNACQSLPDNSREIVVTTGWEADNSHIFIDIRDQGSGIPEDVLRRIKDPFFTTKRDSGGTGLGLAISDRIVQDHGGALEFESGKDMGTKVTATFPVIRKKHNLNQE